MESAPSRESGPFQKNRMSPEFRNMIWNEIYRVLQENLTYSGSGYDYPKWSTKIKPWVKDIWSKHLKQQLDTLESDPKECIGQIKEQFFKITPNEVYKFAEFFCLRMKSKDFEANCNRIFQEQGSAYKFINYCIIMNIKDIEAESLHNSLITPYKEVNEHMDKAIKFLSEKTNPDYHNCLKEAISAIEALVRIITDKPDGTLGALVQNANLNLHKSIQEAIKKVYGFASDEGGIRHSQKSGSKSISYDEALFITVFCSSLINFIIKTTEWNQNETL